MMKHCTPKLVYLPKILNHPDSQLVAFNMSIALKCRSFGTKPLLYQWETRGNNNETWMINGGTSMGRILSLKSIQSTSQARCIVSNECGAVISHTAIITVFSKSCMAVLKYTYAYTFKQKSPLIQKANKQY